MTYFHRDSRTVFFGNPKCGSTSMQAFFASSEGIDVEEWCDSAVYDEVTWEQALGQTRAPGVLAGQWPNLDEESRRQALRSPSVRRIAFVREPLARVWSAWLSKVCFREPAFIHVFPSAHKAGTLQWIERISDLDSAVGEFEEFVADLTSDGPAADDIHFAPQSSFLAALADDTEFLDVSEVDSILMEMQEYSRSAAWRLPQLNATGIPIPLELISSEAKEQLTDFYAGDYRLVDFSGKGEKPLTLDEARLRWSESLPVVRLRVQAAKRLAVAFEEVGRQRDSANIAGAERDAARANVLALEAHARTLEEEIEALRADRDSARAALETVYDSTSWRLTQPARAIGDAIRNVMAKASLPSRRGDR